MRRFLRCLVAGHVLLQPLTRLQEVPTTTIFLLPNLCRSLDHVPALPLMFHHRLQPLRRMEQHPRNHYVQRVQTGGHGRPLPLLHMMDRLPLILVLPLPLRGVMLTEAMLSVMATIIQDELVQHPVATTSYPGIDPIR